MRIKIDEDLPRDVATLLRARGHEAITVVEQGMGGWKDPALWQVIQHEERFLVTADKGFADVRAHPPGTHAGILLLRPDQDGIRPLISLLEQVLVIMNLESLTGAVTVATTNGLRIRRPQT
ncbi:MAG: hypothetical protein EXR62_10560 [Chloroflexi bacterium]|nr:hypothetical protein [Chloroflexota bacterium]